METADVLTLGLPSSGSIRNNFMVFLTYFTLQYFAKHLKRTKAMLGENVEVRLSAESMVLTQHTTPKHNLKKCMSVEYLPKTNININETFLNSSLLFDAKLLGNAVQFYL